MGYGTIKHIGTINVIMHGNYLRIIEYTSHGTIIRDTETIHAKEGHRHGTIMEHTVHGTKSKHGNYRPCSKALIVPWTVCSMIVPGL